MLYIVSQNSDFLGPRDVNPYIYYCNIHTYIVNPTSRQITFLTWYHRFCVLVFSLSTSIFATYDPPNGPLYAEETPLSFFISELITTSFVFSEILFFSFIPLSKSIIIIE